MYCYFLQNLPLLPFSWIICSNFDVFVGCEWIQVNKVRAQAQDPAAFDEM